jgi:hypothetical protein
MIETSRRLHLGHGAQSSSGIRTGTPKDFRANLALACLSIVAGLLIFEVVLRLLDVSFVQQNEPDAFVGWSLRPGVSNSAGHIGPTHVVRINSKGLRDREHLFNKPSNVFRIAILGDSFAEADQVTIPETFWAVMEARLRSCEKLKGRIPEVINFGVAGYGTGQELITLQRKVWRYSPDLVVLLYTPVNDLSDNARALPIYNGGSRMRPYFVLQDRRLVVDNSFTKTTEFQNLVKPALWRRIYNALHDRSRLLQLIGFLRHNLTASPEAVEPMSDGRPLEVQNLQPPSSKAWSNALLVTEELIRTANSEVSQRGARFVLVIGTSGLQIYPDPVARARFQKEQGLVQPFLINQRLNEFARSNRIDVLDLGPPLLEYAESNRGVLHDTNGFGHWNTMGHKLVGELTASKICTRSDF